MRLSEWDRAKSIQLSMSFGTKSEHKGKGALARVMEKARGAGVKDDDWTNTRCGRIDLFQNMDLRGKGY